MKRLFYKDEVWFAVLWIVIYVMGFSTADSISESIGQPKLITAAFGLVLSYAVFLFICKNGLREYFGLCAFSGNYKRFIYFVPLVLISSVNLWCGLTMNYDVFTSVLSVISMCFVGFLEEVIFRGFLFKAMAKTNVKAAIIVSSLTFGMGHVINLLLGEPVLDTLLQLVYAAAIGFCFTAIFYKGGSIVPCIISHAVVNSLSIFAVEPPALISVMTAVSITILSLGYGLWLLRTGRQSSKMKI